jgi:hypothetical protein
MPRMDDVEAKNSENSLFNQLNLYYTDNRGVLLKVNEASDKIDSEFSESLWTNRKNLAKNLPQTSLSSIIDSHKSNKFNKNDLLIETENNGLFEANLKRVRLFF